MNPAQTYTIPGLDVPSSDEIEAAQAVARFYPQGLGLGENIVRAMLEAAYAERRKRRVRNG